MYIKHSKFKNTGILFEILVKKITSDTLSGKNSKAIKIIKEDNFKTPNDDINKFCKLINISKKKFFKICEKFRNKNIWIRNKKKWKLINPIS